MILRDSMREAVRVVLAGMQKFVITIDQEEKLHGVLRLEEVEYQSFEIQGALRRLRDLVERPDDAQDLTPEEMAQAVVQLAQLAALVANIKTLMDSSWIKFDGQRQLLSKRLDPVHARRAELLKLWASGKYTSRDRCAEEEWEALGFPSFRSARESLTGTPNPTTTR